MQNKNFGLKSSVIKNLKAVFESNPKIERVLIYGSRAKGNYYKGSDIDLVVIAPQMSFSEYLRLYSELEELNIPYHIDLAKYELLDDKIKEHIDRVGLEIYKKSTS
mgnify:CR=1 FL=1